jgi:hypothetical protein
MFVRVLAVLVTLGLLVGSFETASARTLSGPPGSALVDDASDDPVDITLVLPPVEPRDEPQPQLTLFAVDAPPHFQPCTIVFRPPRAYAFN